MTTTNHLEFTETFQYPIFQSAAKIVCALKECDPDLRVEAENLLAQLASGDLDEHESFATCALLAEILFPNADDDGMLGLDLVDAEEIARRVNPEAPTILDKMDQQEATFATRLRALLEDRGMTQAELADKIGIGQPAISNMLNRKCRPQSKTVKKIAAALGVAAEVIWPT